MRGAAVVFNPYPVVSSMYYKRKQIIFIVFVSLMLFFALTFLLSVYLQSLFIDTNTLSAMSPKDQEFYLKVAWFPVAVISLGLAGFAVATFFVVSDPSNSGYSVAIVHSGLVWFFTGYRQSYGMLTEHWRAFNPDQIDYRVSPPQLSRTHVWHPFRSLPLVEIRLGDDWLTISNLTSLTTLVIRLFGERRQLDVTAQKFIAQCKAEASAD